jgi:hypothetical protein
MEKFRGQQLSNGQMFEREKRLVDEKDFPYSDVEEDEDLELAIHIPVFRHHNVQAQHVFLGN